MVDNLLKKLEVADLSGKRVVLLPHFCLDHQVSYPGSVEDFCADVKDVVARGGGSIRLENNLLPGGKAVNCARALAALGVHVSIIAKTSPVGLIILEKLIDNQNVDFSLIKTDGEFASTAIIELTENNVMLGDPGSTKDFTSGDISDSGWDQIRKADIVVLSDWVSVDEGTKLAMEVFSEVKNSGRGKTYFDPGDVKFKKEKADRLVGGMQRDLLEQGLIDFISVNESEVVAYGGAKRLAQSAQVELHTSRFAQIINPSEKSAQVASFAVKPVRYTGAGDSWNAGSILGKILGLSDEQQLLLANAVACYYIADPEGKHADLEEITSFINKTKLEKIK